MAPSGSRPRAADWSGSSRPAVGSAPLPGTAIRTAWDEASALLAGLGHEVVDIDVPLPREAVATFELCWAVLTALTEVPEGREHEIRPLTRWLTEKGQAVSARSSASPSA